VFFGQIFFASAEMLLWHWLKCCHRTVQVTHAVAYMRSHMPELSNWKADHLVWTSVNRLFSVGSFAIEVVASEDPRR